MQEYLGSLRAVLRPAFCLSNFPSCSVERHNKPVIEEREPSPELLLPPLTVARSEQECALVERSINSARVSFRFKVADPVEAHLLKTFLRFMVHRADDLEIVRRVPLPSWDLTFLVTWRHLERYRLDALVDFICKFVEDLSSELSAMKLSLRARARAVVGEYWEVLERRQGAAAASEAGGAAVAEGAGAALSTGRVASAADAGSGS